MYAEDDYLQLSGIQHFAYCERQWALIHIEQVWTEDARTAAGRVFHRTVDEQPSDRNRGEIRESRSLPVSSPTLGLSGICDVVEFHRDADGQGCDAGGCRVVPVEYKVGRRKAGDWDEVQLCAEAIALEESLGVTVDMGFIYYGAERRRHRVAMGPDIRRRVAELSESMHAIFESGRLPGPGQQSRCRGCSLIDICMPGMRRDVARYMSEGAADP